MKNIVVLIAVISALFSCSDLKDQGLELYDDYKGICFVVDEQYVPGTKIIMDGNEQYGFDIKWSGTDEIGIYAVSEDVEGNNYPYTAKSENVSNTGFYPSSNLIYSWDKYNDAEFYAYFPFDGVSGRGNVRSVDVSLTGNQKQDVSDAYSAMTDLLFFKSVPAKANDEGSVHFNFYNVFSIVQINLNVVQGSLLDIPIKKIELKSSDNVLVADKVKIDLTKNIGDTYDSLIGEVLEGKKEVSLTFDNDMTLFRGKDNIVNIVVLPGSHSDIKMLVTAKDNSVAEYDLNDASFKSNRVYRKNVTVDVSDFVPADLFDCSVVLAECNVGEPVQFVISGNSDRIDFYSGTFGNDYKYAETDRIIVPEMNLSFETYANSGSGNPLSVSVFMSNDFSGEYTEESVKSATWTDLSGKFAFPQSVGERVASGQYDICQNLGEHEEFYLAYKYVVKGNSFTRTKVFLNNFLVEKTGAGIENEEMYSHQNANWQLVLFSVYNGVTSTNCPQITETSIQFTADLKPDADREAWAVSGKMKKAEDINLGHDLPIHIKTEDQEQISSYSYVFSEPGEYSVVFVSVSETLSGEKTEKREFKITVK